MQPPRLAIEVALSHHQHFDDREPQPLAIVDCHRVAAVHFSLHAKARRLQEVLHRGIERYFQHTV
jgi:hypothetical protein